MILSHWVRRDVDVHAADVNDVDFGRRVEQCRRRLLATVTWWRRSIAEKNLSNTIS